MAIRKSTYRDINFGDTILFVERNQKAFLLFNPIWNNRKEPILYRPHKRFRISSSIDNYFLQMEEDVAQAMFSRGDIMITRMVLTEKTWENLT